MLYLYSNNERTTSIWCNTTTISLTWYTSFSYLLCIIQIIMLGTKHKLYQVCLKDYLKYSIFKRGLCEVVLNEYLCSIFQHQSKYFMCKRMVCFPKNEIWLELVRVPAYKNIFAVSHFIPVIRIFKVRAQ